MRFETESDILKTHVAVGSAPLGSSSVGDGLKQKLKVMIDPRAPLAADSEPISSDAVSNRYRISSIAIALDSTGSILPEIVVSSPEDSVSLA